MRGDFARGSSQGAHKGRPYGVGVVVVSVDIMIYM